MPSDISQDTDTPASLSRVKRVLGTTSESVRSMHFWLPPFLLMGLFVYGAIGWNLVISFTEYSGFGDPNYSALGFQNYARAFTDPEVIFAVQNTVVLTVGFTVLSLALGLFLAVLLDRQVRSKGTFRTIYLLPMSLSFVVTGQFWLWMYDVDSGIVNTLLGVVGLGPFDWVGNPKLVLFAIMFALIWQFSGYAMVVYLAGLQAIPDDQFEAAKIDGSGTVNMYLRIIIPQLRGATIGASVVLIAFSLRAFDFLFSIFGGYRPQNGADILATKMVRVAFQRQEWAYGAAIAMILFSLALLIIGPYLYHQYKRGEI
ncbi:sugar ABC transporter permease [Haloferax sp. Atlit-4N]|uniref:carbohydrate ABC transporter permease n=1 Tax=unclassified Haloferax TaxID=2625095 RepID=UPI000E22A89B|nr:sugar ABC transporter permease [Haloferax sp. Atlit-19N]RDZ50223.1 sugar ABC transporter permease [Haloferax sp. Atlit-4N]